MARKNNLSPPNEEHNDDSREPEDANNNHEGRAGTPESENADAGFDPTELETDHTTSPPGQDIFDPTFLGLSQDFAAESNVAKKWDIIKVEKPSKSRVFRVHPDPKLRIKTVL